MGKAVLISIRPEWCFLIAIGQKTLELRRVVPNLPTPYKVYIYCTKGKTLYRSRYNNEIHLYHKQANNRFDHHHVFNGKVIGEWTCDTIVPIRWQNYAVDWGMDEGEYNVSHLQLSAACVTEEELLRYGEGKDISGLYIPSVKIYDKPKELSEFHRPCQESLYCESCAMWNERRGCGNAALQLNRPPQSWLFVEEL